MKQIRHPIKQLRGAWESGWNFDVICWEIGKKQEGFLLPNSSIGLKDEE